MQVSALQNIIEDGGLAWPDIRLHYHAAMISAVVQWWNHQDELTWAEGQLNIPVPLSEWMLLKTN